jgi:hypothetical protein
VREYGEGVVVSADHHLLTAREGDSVARLLLREGCRVQGVEYRV